MIESAAITIPMMLSLGASRHHSSQVGSGGNATHRFTSYHVALEPPQIIGTFYF